MCDQCGTPSRNRFFHNEAIGSGDKYLQILAFTIVCLGIWDSQGILY